MDPLAATKQAQRSASRMRPPALSLAQRLLARLAARHALCTHDIAIDALREGRLTRNGRWLSLRINHPVNRGVAIVYAPYGDDRDIEGFSAATNQEQRRRIVEACGERVLPPDRRELTQQDDYGQLWTITTTEPRALCETRASQQVRVVCPSTGAVYWLPVSHRCRTAREAVAETFGLSARDYTPCQET
jgi:hypothetical protein